MCQVPYVVLTNKQFLLLLILHVFFHTRHPGLYNTDVCFSYVYKINTVLQDFITHVCLSQLFKSFTVKPV